MVVPRMQASGIDVAIACNSGHSRGMWWYPGPRGPIPLYPQGREAHSADIVHHHASHWGADVVFTHYDAWCYHPKRPGVSSMKHPWVPWFPIDSDDVPTLVLDTVRGVRGAAFRVTQTHHGVAAMEAHNTQCAYVPASYDSRVYRPMDRRQAREDMGVGDRFFAVMVSNNTGTKDAPSRKAFPQVFQAFKWFLESEPDALLYVHAFTSGHLELEQHAAEVGIIDNIRFADSYDLHSGHYGAEDMATLYNAADVLVNPSMGEGFGVPIVEAQACGTPVITGDWTAMSEVTRTGYKIPKERSARYQLVGYGGDMFIPQSEAIRDALVEAVGWDYDPAEVSAAVAEYEIEHVYETHWLPALEEVEALVAPAPRLNREQRRAKQREKVA
jgi:glycosyltransferase involved in cell wall biosynthesis